MPGQLPTDFVAYTRVVSPNAPQIALPTPASPNIQYLIKHITATLMSTTNAPGQVNSSNVDIVDSGSLSSPFFIAFLAIPNAAFSAATFDGDVGYLGTVGHGITVQFDTGIGLASVIATLIVTGTVL